MPAAQPSCATSVQKWEKSCGEAGYPPTFVGKISGETRGNCTDGTLQDVWVANTCTPPGAATPKAKEPVIAKAPETPKAEAALPETATVAIPEAPEVAATQPEKIKPVAEQEESKGFFSRMYSSVIDTFSFGTESAPEPKTAGANEPSATQEQVALQEQAPKDANDFCGPASETMAYEAPQKNLCRIGSASAVSGEGPWTWACTNNEGATSACKTLSLGGTPAKAATSKAGKAQFVQLPKAAAKTKTPAPKPACGAASGQPAKEKPTSALCEEGKASTVRGSNPWKWTCGAGKQKVSCETVKFVDGACGAANGTMLKAVPTKNLCKKGTASEINGEGPWVWSCEGMGGGEHASCSAQRAAAPEAVPPKPEVLKEKTEIPTPAKSLTKAAPTPTPVPAPAKVEGDEAPEAAPSLPADSKPVPPPAVKETLPVTKALKETPVAERPVKATGAPLVLDATISTILFSHGSGAIEEKVFVTLDKLVAALQKNPSARISLYAYADSVGTNPRSMKRLSLTRALAVRDYLASKGIPESRVDVHAEGTDTTSGYADRVDVRVND